MKDTVNPNDFIITRKRKKYRFALFANSPICFEFDDWQKQAVDSIEVGAGTGMFSVELATKYPDQQFVALDVKADRLQKGAGEAVARGLTNLRFIRARADQLAELFPAQSIASIWVTFPDPCPKNGSAGRRLTHPIYLVIYQNLLKQSGRVLLKHDSRRYFNWSLEQFVSERWSIQELSFDLHGSKLADDYKIITTYEQRWLREGLTTNLLVASPPQSHLPTPQ